MKERKVLSLLLAFVMVLSLLPAGALAAEPSVSVTIKNSTDFTSSEGAAWDGTLVNTVPVPLLDGDTAASVLTHALTSAVNGKADYTSTGIEANYLTEINGLKAGDATAAGKNPTHPKWDGWCFALNGIMPSVGLGDIRVQDGDKLVFGYSLDGTLDGAAYGGGNDATSGFTFSGGVFSYIAGTYGNSYLLSLPAAGTVRLTAVPNADNKAVRVYLNGSLTGGLNTDLSLKSGDSLQIVLGSYDTVYTIPVRTVGEIDTSALQSGISARLGDSTASYWNIVGQLANNSGFVYSDAARQSYLNTAIAAFNASSKNGTTLAMHIIALRALGYDVSTLSYQGSSCSAFDVLKSQMAADTKSYGWNEIYAYGLMAYLQAGDTLRTAYDGEIKTCISLLVAHPTGDWGYGTSADTAGITLAALEFAKAKGYSVDNTAIDTAVAYLEKAIQSDGTVIGYDGKSNANSTAMALLGLDAAGVDVSKLTAENASGNLRGGLLLYALGDNSGFDYNGGEYNGTATQQSFLALTASEKAGAANVFDFSGNTLHKAAVAYDACPVTISSVPSSAAVAVTKSGETTAQTPIAAGSYDLAAGDYTYTVSKNGYTSKSGSFSVSTDDAAKHTAKSISVSLASAVSGSTGGSTITVNFTLVGDTAHGDGGTVHVYNKDGGAGRTWVTKTSFTVPAGSSVFDVFDRACAANGVDYLEKSEGYFYSLSKSGVTLSELTNGKNAGWLYLVNGASPLVTIRQYKLSDGDCIVFYYSDDYTLEKGSEMWGGGAASDSTVTVPITNGSASTPVSAAVSGATATVSANETQLAAVAVQSGEDAKTLDLSAVGKSVTNAVVPAKLVAAVSGGDRSGSLALTLPTGTVTLDKAALAAAAATGNDISVSLSAVSPETLTAAQKRALGEKAGSAVVVSASILAGGEKLTDFGGGSITVTVPYTPKDGEDTACLTVWYLAGDGSITPMTGSYDAAAKTFSFTTPHLSSYVVVAFPFADVAAGSWYYGSAAYCYMNGLLAGTSAESFSPELTTSRAMLAAVLYRLAGSPAVTEKAAFTDVAAGSWYESAVSWAAKAGIVTGVDAARFDPDADVTREQAAAMLYRYAKFKGIDTTQGGMSVREFTDYASVSSYALEAVQWAVNAKLLQGSDSKLDPAASATRAQAAALLQRLAGISA